MSKTLPSFFGHDLMWGAYSGEIRMRKVPMKATRLPIIGTCCIFSRIEGADIPCFVVESNHANPATAPGRMYALKLMLVCASFLLVASVLGRRAFAKILATVIQRVPVAMVSLFLRLAIKKLSVHTDALPTFISTDGVESLHPWSPRGAPVKGRHLREIFKINNGVLTLREWNQAVRWVKRLSDRVSWHAAFHRSTSNGLNFSAALYQVPA